MALTSVIRPATLADLPKLAAIEHECFGVESWAGDQFLKHECVIVEIEGRQGTFEVAGFLVSRQIFAGSMNSPPEREILNIAVAGRYRREGLASLLLRYEIARGTHLFLEVRESNDVAQRLYRKMGFIEMGRRRDYYESPRESAIVMRAKW